MEFSQSRTADKKTSSIKRIYLSWAKSFGWVKMLCPRQACLNGFRMEAWQKWPTPTRYPAMVVVNALLNSWYQIYFKNILFFRKCFLFLYSWTWGRLYFVPFCWFCCFYSSRSRHSLVLMLLFITVLPCFHSDIIISYCSQFFFNSSVWSSDNKHQLLYYCRFTIDTLCNQKEMHYATDSIAHTTAFVTPIGEQWIEDRNVLFNDTLNTFYLWLYGIRYMVKDHSDRKPATATWATLSD